MWGNCNVLLRETKTSLVLATVTVLTSCTIAYTVNGTLSDDVRIVDLATWGGVTLSDIVSGRPWRFLTAQLVHVKIPHMLFNAVSLYLVGAFVETRAGGRAVLLVWLVAGGLATLFSPVLIDPPYNVGTGASQAVIAVGGFAAVLLRRPAWRTAYGVGVTVLATIPPFFIDLAYAGYPKPGHLLALVLGVMFALIWSWRNREKESRA